MTPKVFMLADKPTYMLDREGRALDMGTWYNEMFRRMACDFAAVLTNSAGIFIGADTHREPAKRLRQCGGEWLQRR